MMNYHHYWAKWDAKTCAPNFIRKDTRVYFHPSASHQRSGGNCIGTLYGENPGGAKPLSGVAHHGWTALKSGGLPGDPTMRLLWEVWERAIQLKRLSYPEEDDYIEVLNVYYFACGTSAKMLPAWLGVGKATHYQPSIRAQSQFTILGWGGKDGVNSLAKAQLAAVVSPGCILTPDSSFTVQKFPSGTTIGAAFPPFPVSPSYANSSPKVRRPLYIQNVAVSL